MWGRSSTKNDQVVKWITFLETVMVWSFWYVCSVRSTEYYNMNTMQHTLERLALSGASPTLQESIDVFLGQGPKHSFALLDWSSSEKLSVVVGAIPSCKCVRICHPCGLDSGGRVITPCAGIGALLLENETPNLGIVWVRFWAILAWEIVWSLHDRLKGCLCGGEVMDSPAWVRRFDMADTKRKQITATWELTNAKRCFPALWHINW